MIRIKEIAIILIGSIIFAYILHLAFPQGKIDQSLVSPSTQSINATEVKHVEQLGNSKELESIVLKSLENAAGTYGIYVKNLRTGEEYSLNPNREFGTASLYKLWLAAASLDLISKERLTRSEVMSKDFAELNELFNINEEDAELTEGGITITVYEAIEQMIISSRNYPALLLSSHIDNSTTANYIKEIGLTESNYSQPPATTASDIAKFYELLYEGEIVNQVFSAELMEILTRQQFNDRIPKYLPENIDIAHKTGELGTLKHDAGIIFAKDAILFVALSETNSQTTAAENIARLSETVFEYFENK